MNVNKWTFPIVIVALVSLIFSGCGSKPGSGKPRGNVTVTILFDGKPVTKGQVNLENLETGEGGGGELNDEGKVALSYIVQGEYRVVVLPPDLPPEPDKQPTVIPTFNNLPEIFQDATTSPLKLKVTEEPGEFTFDLSSQ